MKRGLLVLALSLPCIFAVAQEADSLYGGSLKEAGVSANYSSILFSGEITGPAVMKSAPTLSDVLRQFGGVQVKDYGGVGGLKTVNVRSLGSEHTAVFIDGIPVDNAQNAQVDLGRFSPEDFASARLGSATPAASGLHTAREMGASNTVSLSTAAPSFAPGRKDSFRARLRGGSFSTFSPALYYGRKLRRSTLSISTEAISTSGRYKFHERKYQVFPDGRRAGYDTIMTRENGDLLSFRAQARLAGRSGRDGWSAVAYWYDSERGLPGPVVRRPQGAILSKDRQEDRDAFVQGGWTREGESWAARLLAKYSLSHTRYRTNPEEDPQAMPVDNSFDQQAGYISLSGLYALSDKWTLSAAADGRIGKLDSDMRNFVYPRRIEGWAAFGSAFQGDKFDISTSLQYAIASDTFDGDSGGAFSRESGTRQALSPSITFEYLPLRNGIVTISGFAKRTFRMPTFNDLYYTLVGNVSLRPEDARQLDIGARISPRPGRKLLFEGGIETYLNYVKDKIVAVPTANQFRWTMYNIGKVRIAGAEFRGSMLWSPDGLSMVSRGASLTLRYTFQSARDFSQPGKSTYGGQIPYIPLHSASLSAAAFSKGWRIDLSVLYDSRRWSSSANTGDFELGAFWTADAWLSKTMDFGESGLILRLEAGNLFGRQYEIVRGYPMPGFNIMGAVEYYF